MELTKQQLKELLPKNPYIDQWHNALSQLLPDYEINTPQRIAAFIAQCAHESGNFIFLSENLNYKAESLTKILEQQNNTKRIHKRLPTKSMQTAWVMVTKHLVMDSNTVVVV